MKRILAYLLFAITVFGQKAENNLTVRTNLIAGKFSISSIPNVMQGSQLLSDEQDLATTDPAVGYFAVVKTGTAAGHWYWDSTSTATEGDGVISALGYATGRWIRLVALTVPDDLDPNKGVVIGANKVLQQSTATKQQVDNTAMQVATVAEMRALDPAQLNNGQLIKTGGRLTNGDGGGLTFRYVASSTTATNFGTVFAFTSGTGRLVWTGGEQVDVRAFGAIADTATDNTITLQDALNYGSSSGTPIYIPDGWGQAFLTGQLTATGFLTLRGENDPNALNTAETGIKSVIRRKSGDSISAAVLVIPSGIQCSITGVAFDGDRFNNGSNTNAVVDFQGSGTNYDKRSMRRVSVRYATGYGIKIGSAEAYLDNVVVLDGGGVGIYLRGQDNIWNNILVGRNAGDGIYIDNSSPFPSGAFRSKSIDSYQNQGHGLYLIIPFTDIFDKLVCNNNNKCGVYMISDVSNASRNVFEKGEFVNNNFPDVVYATSRGSLTTSSSPHASGTFANFYVTGTGAASANIWIPKESMHRYELFNFSNFSLDILRGFSLL